MLCQVKSKMDDNPCLHCGACCARFRVSFYWREADEDLEGTVPADLTEELPPFRRCMKGTNRKQPRCVALEGEIGIAVHCAIYGGRPSPCREFGVQWGNGALCIEQADLKRCNQARAAWGLPPLAPSPARPIPLPNDWPGVRQDA